MTAIPNMVLPSIGKLDESSAILDELRAKDRVDILKAENSRLAEALGNRLGRGEAEAIAIALERETDLVRLDDYAARAEAMRLGLEVKGTLGIVRRLMELDMFQCDTGSLLQNLKRMDFRVKDKIFWEIFRDIRQTS